MHDVIAKSLGAKFDQKLVEELLEAYRETKDKFLLGGLRLSEVEGGRFCEAAMRLLEQAAFGTFTPLGPQIDSENLFNRLRQIPRGKQHDSIRLNIPRAIRVIYDIRNGRDAAHLGAGDVDPNLQDATLVISNIDWVLAEFVRLYHNVKADEAQRIVDGLVVRAVPAVQDFDGFLKVLNPKLKASQYVLLLLYERGTTGATLDELRGWVQPKMRANLGTTVKRLVDDIALESDSFGRNRF
ncbi:MAG TPA: hypothetical protein VGU20_17385 [Stellaceae bacterium]|nr:hypothetical protein [Stellaceae bacterium]